MKKEPFVSWETVEKNLNISEVQQNEIDLEVDLIKTLISERQKKNLSQRDLSEKTGLKQPAIARIESLKNSPKVNTLIKLLYPLGYTLKIVPISKKEK